MTYFTGDLFIPNIGKNKSSVVSSNTDFQYYIDQFEREILIKALGVRLYNEFISNIDTDPQSPNYGNVDPSADQQWKDLLNGSTYSDKVWRGLRYEVGTRKLSLMAYYVFYKYLEEKHIQRTTLGVVKADAENANVVNPSFVMEKAWRAMYEWYGKGYRCCCDYDYFFGLYYYDDCCCDDKDYKREFVDLYTFLNDNRSLYPNWVFTTIKNKNRFGL